MKMGCFITSGLFWGVLLILLGVTVIIKVIFNVDIPLFRIFFALFLIYLGIKALAGGRCYLWKNNNSVIFNERKIDATNVAKKYDVIFSRSIIDLSNTTAKNESVEINTVLGASVVKINPQHPIKIVANAVFAGTQFPDGSTISFGEYVYKTPKYIDGKSALEIKIDVIFGDVEIVTN